VFAKFVKRHGKGDWVWLRLTHRSTLGSTKSPCEAASTCLTLFRFGKWQGNGNSKNVTAAR
jgi:hypothetical protein